jgi:antitoxin FitA
MYADHMTKTLQIRDVPDDVHATVRSRAAREGLSVSEYLLRQITELAEQPTVAEVLERARQRSGGVSVQDIVAVIREGRGE